MSGFKGNESIRARVANMSYTDEQEKALFTEMSFSDSFKGRSSLYLYRAS